MGGGVGAGRWGGRRRRGHAPMGGVIRGWFLVGTSFTISFSQESLTIALQFLKAWAFQKPLISEIASSTRPFSRGIVGG